MKNKAGMKAVLCLVILMGLALILTAFSGRTPEALAASVALRAGSAYLPTVKAAEVCSDTASPSDTEAQKEETKPSATEKEAAVTVTSEPSTQAVTEGKTPEAPLSLTSEAFLKTDEDVLAAAEKAQKKGEKDKKDGSIREYQYKEDGVTDKYGLVRVKNVNKTDISIKKLLSKSLELEVKSDEPTVLIFHTHTTETYELLDRGFYATTSLTRTENKALNMVRVGEETAEEIKKAGFSVLHDKIIHDYTYNTAYAHSRKTVEEYLKQYPSIKIVLDLHRDAIHRSDGTKIKPTAEINGKKAAQIMIISGCQEQGNGVEGFEGWRDNLVFALHLQNTLEKLFKGITRPLYFSPRKYNMDLTPFSLLVEIGSDANTLEEAVYTGRCLGRAVSEILKQYEEQP